MTTKNKTEKSQPSDIKILIVDNDEIALFLLKSQVEKIGYQALTANSPTAAIKIMEKEAADIALVISDYKMPEMTGLELCNVFLAKWNEVPFALISGTVPAEISQLLEKNSICGYIKKPINKADIEALIKNKSAIRIAEIKDERDIVSSAVEEYTSALEELEALILELEENPADVKTVNRIFGIIHTIKGSSSFFRPKSLSKFCHLCEDSLIDVKKGKIPITAPVISILLKSRDVLVSLVEALKNGDRTERDLVELAKIYEPVKDLGGFTDAASLATEASASSKDSLENTSQKGKDWLKVSRSAIENFLKTNGEITIIRNMIDKFLRLELSKGRRDDGMEKLYRMFEQMFKHQGLMHSQMTDLKKVSLAEVFRQAKRIVRDLNKQLGKEVLLAIDGEDFRVDDSLIEIINTSLVHLLRNSLDHGIESTADRTTAGKDPNAKISVKIYEQEEMVFVEITDDGRGIDTEKIRKKLVDSQQLSQSDANKLSEKQLVDYIFKSGFTTAQKVTSVSGRGVGLDMVNTSIRNIKGTINVETHLGKGTKFTISLPTPKSIVIFKSLIIQRAGLSYAVPQEGIKQVIDASFYEEDDNSIQKMDGRHVLKLRQENIPLFTLEEVLGEVHSKRQMQDDTSKKTVLILGGIRRNFGIVIDNVLGLEDTVVKPLGDNYENKAIYLGATILGNGEVGLVINPEGISKQIAA